MMMMIIIIYLLFQNDNVYTVMILFKPYIWILYMLSWKSHYMMEGLDRNRYRYIAAHNSLTNSTYFYFRLCPDSFVCYIWTLGDHLDLSVWERLLNNPISPSWITKQLTERKLNIFYISCIACSHRRMCDVGLFDKWINQAVKMTLTSESSWQKSVCTLNSKIITVSERHCICKHTCVILYVTGKHHYCRFKCIQPQWMFCGRGRGNILYTPTLSWSSKF